MSPNCISHRLFVAALSSNKEAAGKRPARSVKRLAKSKADAGVVAPPAGAVAPSLAPWAWSGWQQPML